jgi:hypothetical protein
MDQADGRAGGELAQQEKTDGTGGERGDRLFVVRISESCCEPLAQRGPVEYVSPPQPLEAARSLVALLAGRNHVDAIDVGEYAVPVAGGRRTITLEAAG